MRALWLPAVLRDAGLTVHTHSGWEGRGRPLGAIQAIIGHDTVAGQDPGQNRSLLIHGREGLAGPLSQLGGCADGSVDVYASGRASHNGYGKFGNDALGWEVHCYGGLKGREQRWNGAQEEAFVAGCAAIRRHLGQPDLPILGHKESDPKRKIDPWNVDMNAVRRRIDGFTEEDDDMTGPESQMLKDLHVAMGDVQSELAEVEVRQRQLKYRDDAMLAIMRKAFPELQTDIDTILAKLEQADAPK